MRLYDCKVRLAGSLYNEVAKHQVTAAEITVLRTLHGADSVVDIKMSDAVADRGQGEERERLMAEYGGGLMAAQLGKTPEQAMAGVFGLHGSLPDSVPGSEIPAEVKPTRKPKPDPLLSAEE